MKRISDEVIINLIYRTGERTSLEDHRDTAQAQLESCEKERETELCEIAKALGYPKEATIAPCNVLAHAVKTLASNYTALQGESEARKELINRLTAKMEADKKEHKKVVGEIFKEMEENYYPDPRIGVEETKMDFHISPSWWQALKQKYLEVK